MFYLYFVKPPKIGKWLFYNVAANWQERMIIETEISKFVMFTSPTPYDKKVHTFNKLCAQK